MSAIRRPSCGLMVGKPQKHPRHDRAPVEQEHSGHQQPRQKHARMAVEDGRQHARRERHEHAGKALPARQPPAQDGGQRQADGGIEVERHRIGQEPERHEQRQNIGRIREDIMRIDPDTAAEHLMQPRIVGIDVGEDGHLALYRRQTAGPVIGKVAAVEVAEIVVIPGAGHEDDFVKQDRRQNAAEQRGDWRWAGDCVQSSGIGAPCGCRPRMAMQSYNPIS